MTGAQDSNQLLKRVMMSSSFLSTSRNGERTVANQLVAKAVKIDCMGDCPKGRANAKCKDKLCKQCCSDANDGYPCAAHGSSRKKSKPAGKETVGGGGGHKTKKRKKRPPPLEIESSSSEELDLQVLGEEQESSDEEPEGEE